MKCAILGFGTIGAGVYELARRAGFEVARILDLRPVPEGLASTMEEILADPSVELVAETMGGLHPAYEFCLAALEQGKHLVTANKYLVSEYGEQLAAAARERGVSFRFSAACGGGIPFLPALQEAARCDRILCAGGILNGTTNYILDRMQRFGEGYGQALEKAQALGYAERDPSADVDGLDAMRKGMLLSAVAFGVMPADMPVAGIRNLTGADVAWFKEHSRVCRLLVRSDGRAAWVEPTLVSPSAPEASIRENVNLAWFEGESVGRFAMTGQGAGRYPTAGNVVRDMLNLHGGVMLPEGVSRRPADCAGAAHRYYVRLPGEETGRLTDEVVSVSAMHAKMKEHPGAFFAGWSEENT